MNRIPPKMTSALGLLAAAMMIPALMVVGFAELPLPAARADVLTAANRVVSAKVGATAADRVVLSASATGSAPTLATHGFPLPPSGWVHLYADLASRASVTFDLYIYSEVAAAWFKLRTGLVMTAGADDNSYIVQHQGEHRLAIVVTGFGSGTGTVKFWAGVSP